MGTSEKLEIGYGLSQGNDAFAAGMEAARQALSGLKEYAPTLVIVFASVRYELEALLRGVNSAVGEVPLVGATTAGEICNGPHQDSVVVTILASPYLEVAVGVGERVSQDWRQAVAQAVSSPGLTPFFTPAESTAWSELTLQGKAAFALLFAPGETSTAYVRSFEILEELKRLSQGRLPVIGGCAGDDLQMATNFVFWGGRAYSDSLILAICQTRLRFGIAMAHGFLPTSRWAVATRTSDHEVLELDGQEAAEVFSRLHNQPREDLEGKHLTLTTKGPMGVPDPYGQYSITVPSYFTPRGGVRFSQPIPEGTVLTVMESSLDSMITAGTEALRKALLRGSITRAAAILSFSCVLRPSFLGDRIIEESRGMQGFLPEVPITGFYSMGEQALADDGVNRNNTAVIAVLVLGRELSYAAQVALERERLRSEVEQAEVVKTAYEALKKEVAERQKAEQALRDNERFLANIFDCIQDGLTILDADLNICRANLTMENRFPQSRPIVGKKCYAVFHGRQAPCEVCPARQTLETGKASHKLVSDTLPDGTALNIEVFSYPLVDPANGKVTGVIEYSKDITERVQAEEALRRSEEQLRQSQKMEAVGRLAGGIAHDFNNILMVISGYTGLLLHSVIKEDKAWQDIKQIQRATDRAATLIQQLLVFSRKQVIRPELLNINLVVAKLDKMFRRLIREDIDLRTILEPELGAVLADRGQIEQVIINLLVNAQDAMPQGGKLTLETANVDLDQDMVQSWPQAKPGPYVLLTVSDTGLGMERDIREHLFEPFFTTKKRGEGTGLGLSMAYAIVNQGGGFIAVCSEPGQGTTFKIHLPRLERIPEPAESPLASASEEVVSETILLAEDEEIVRQVIRRILAGKGYTVLEAGSGPEALKISEQHQGKIHLLLSDVLMPEMSGPQLAKALSSLRPETKVLFMSGHTDNAIVHHGVLEPGIAFIQKPFSREALLRKLREVIDSARSEVSVS